MKLQELLRKQKELDNHIITKHNLIESELFDKRVLACLVELGEQANESATFKYWKLNKVEDRKKVSEELVDVLHFLLSVGNLLEIECNEVTQSFVDNPVKMETVEKQYITLFNLVSNVGLFEDDEMKRHFWKHAISIYIGLYEQLGFGTGYIEAEYDKKHAENYARQESNY